MQPLYLSTGCRLREPILGTVEGMWLDVPPTLSKNHIKRSIELDGDKLAMLNEIRDKVSNHTNADTAIRQYSRVFRKACDKAKTSASTASGTPLLVSGDCKRMEIWR